MRSIEPDTIPVAAILKILMPGVKLVTFCSELQTEDRSMNNRKGKEREN